MDPETGRFLVALSCRETSEVELSSGLSSTLWTDLASSGLGVFTESDSMVDHLEDSVCELERAGAGPRERLACGEDERDLGSRMHGRMEDSGTTATEASERGACTVTGVDVC